MDKERTYYVPNRNTYDMFTEVRVVGETKDLRGQQMVRVQALSGKPWWDKDGFTFSEQNFYPEFIKERVEDLPCLN
jgi:hypothetical protein